MQVLKVQFAPWDRCYDFSNNEDLSIKEGDYVMVETEAGKDIGRVIEIASGSSKIDELKNILGLAGTQDLAKMPSPREKDDIISYCKTLVKHHDLPMKVIDVHLSCDGGRMKFAFVADGRVDFRELVKDLNRHFNKSIILYQVGIRDEAKISGDIGHCGRQQLCCGRFLKDVGGVTTEMSETQQVAHRGSERLSGQCGRLMCCLRYEQDGYKELEKTLPSIGSRVKYEGTDAEVIGWHTLKQALDLKVYNAKNNYERIFDVPLSKVKSKK